MVSKSINVDDPSVLLSYRSSDSSSYKRYKGDETADVNGLTPLPKYVLRDEIPKEKLTKSLCENPSPGVFELLFDMNIKIDWDKLAKHPDAFTDLPQLEKIIKSGVSSKFLLSLCENSKNPIVINFMINKINKGMEGSEKYEITEGIEKNKRINEYLIFLAKNPHPFAINFVSQHSIIQNSLVSNRITAFQEKIIKSLAGNPTRKAMELMESILKNLKPFEKRDLDIPLIKILSDEILMKLLVNPQAMKYIKDILPLDYKLYSTLLHRNPNSNAFELLDRVRAAHPKNPEYTLENNYYFLSENPSSRAIKILKERMEEEKLISRDEYYKLRNENGPRIFLNWISISKNPKAKSLILAKIEDEKDRKQEITEDIRNGYSERHLNWDNVSANPAIFKRKRKETIDKEKIKEIELYLYPNTEVEDILHSEIKKVFIDDDITNDIISELNIGSVDELIRINPLKLVLKLVKSTSKVGKENIEKLKKLIADLKIKYPRSSSSNGS